ncbi:hypothetical protein TNCV_4157361 [Trichonephila clavipes]|nr:hypothetical protein TNCV_4157361 [Trichonephila clavipes]
MTIHRPLTEQNLRSYQSLRHLRLTLAHCRARLRWCLARSEDKAIPQVARASMNYLTACQTLPWPARSPDISSIEHVWDMMGR